MKEELLAQCERSISKAIEAALTGYSSPLIGAVREALESNNHKLKAMASESVNELLDGDEFKKAMKSEMKKKLARVLISQFGGELEKTVNKLKADPTARAKMTVAVDNVIDELINI